eukprot:gene6182-11581_t
MKKLYAIITCALVVLTLIGFMYLNEFSVWYHTSIVVKNPKIVSASTKKKHEGTSTMKVQPNGGEQSKCVDDGDRYSQVKFFVLFIGYSRSGSTLLGSLLDAHPNVIVANEYGVGDKLSTFTAAKKNRNYLFNQLYNNSQWYATKSYRSSTYRGVYNYHVPKQWQGKYNCSIQVIGDKKAVQSVRTFSDEEGDQRLNELGRIVKVPIKFVHIHRNPFDTIATMLLQHKNARSQATSSHFKPLNDQKELRRCVNRYLNRVKRLEAIKAKRVEDVVDIEYSKLQKNEKIWGECEKVRAISEPSDFGMPFRAPMPVKVNQTSS